MSIHDRLERLAITQARSPGEHLVRNPLHVHVCTVALCGPDRILTM